ncbi:helix-turn-helix transcriptional regulator [Dysgonomonas sp. Marseille-P4677]|uniref:helix-turn-helix domain-containing protein n=1 Tax=Dysgonomonas sp. Marseille-P4677 TaxID=2364790 RepID=UPI00191475E7|nr:helix-turn-helix transcriptional regulator [Dysgonomonas sp. Marseille-P4677]MBK5723102.1 helix-turn-helix transcriptional regulator [Dysgonomonas sp. Marseille-P4677]
MVLRIKEVVRERGLQLSDLATMLGINRVSLSQQINGNPTVETLQKIAHALNVPISELFERSDNDTIGIIRHKGKSYDINSIEDIKKILAEIENVNINL